jgi:hypothetical protein
MLGALRTSRFETIDSLTVVVFGVALVLSALTGWAIVLLTSPR